LKAKGNVVRLIEDNINNDYNVDQKPLADPHHRFYKKPIDYGFSVYACYKCNKCNRPYIGGIVNCDNEADANIGEQFNPEDYVCMSCGGMQDKCDKHGEMSIIYKCKFCCNLALFFCGGNTHYCNWCHSNNVNGRAYPCLGLGKCKLFEGKHPPNGKEARLGCELCLR